MTGDRLYFLMLNIGHFMDHLFTLIFASVAALPKTLPVPDAEPSPAR